MDDATRCPCLSGETYGACCGPLHRGELAAPTAERLMRSRYSAFAVLDEAYLLATWHATTRPAALGLDAGTRWFRLEILGTRAGGPDDATGVVEFEARCRTAEGAEVLHEVSRFVRDGRERRWSYVDGVVG